MLNSILGKKLGSTQAFLENGKRVPLSKIFVGGNVVSQVKTMETDGYESIQLGFGEKRKTSKPLSGHIKKAGLKKTPRFFREVRADKIEDHELGGEVNASEILAAGDMVDVTGNSKGKGYAGVVKRHGFSGGPKTHGQSDRHRAPGSIGQSTTPGRVYKGKRMAGRMGNERVTVKNLEVIELSDDGVLLVKGLVPGVIGSLVTITRRGENRKHMGLYKEPVMEEVVDEKKVEEIGESIEEQEKEKAEDAAEARQEELKEQTESQIQESEEKEEVKTETPEELIEEAEKPETEEVAKKETEISEIKEEAK